MWINAHLPINGYPGGNLHFGYEYHPNGSLASITYPSGRTINYGVDGSGRTNEAFDSSKTYANITSFAPDGRIKQMQVGSLYETREYPTPGPNTPTTFSVGTAPGLSDRLKISYFFPATGNQGNVVKQQIQRQGLTWTQNYTYDGVNRLKTASEVGGFSQTYSYDGNGNRKVTVSTGLAHQDSLETSINFDLATNRIVGFNYDPAGNQTSYHSNTLNYDAENRNTEVIAPDQSKIQFSYDGDGHRVRKVVKNPSGQILSTTYFVYDAHGTLALEYSTDVPSTAGTSYMTTDMLGSVRAISSSTGAISECYDYLPFGRMLSSADNQRGSCFQSDPDNQIASRTPQKFTGKERDAETGLDYFGARYHSGPEGRFMSPDTPLLDQKVSEPQSWNLYAYVRNNPLKYVDIKGQYITIPMEGRVLRTYQNLNYGSSDFAEMTDYFNDSTHNISIVFQNLGIDAENRPIRAYMKPSVAEIENGKPGRFEATIVIDNAYKDDSSALEGILSEEISHGHRAATDPKGYQRDARIIGEDGMRILHDNRPEEQRVVKTNNQIKEQMEQSRKVSEAVRKIMREMGYREDNSEAERQLLCGRGVKAAC